MQPSPKIPKKTSITAKTPIAYLKSSTHKIYEKNALIPFSEKQRKVYPSFCNGDILGSHEF